MKTLSANLALWPLLAGMLTLSTQAGAEVSKEDLTYIGVNWTQLEFERILGHRKGTAYAGTLVLGTYITDYVKTEFRAGLGVSDDEINSSTRTDAFGQQEYISIGVEDYYSWYMGAQYPATDYMTVFAQFGFTHMIGKVEYPDPDQPRRLPDDLTDSSFSMSYILGADIRIYGDFWGTLEYGRLHRDSITDIRTNQMSAGIKYEF
ncbi:porin family protein [Hahella ganghwensis]|uniref:porin family protein n=1 Tax=Hahella ganghwensis TaxID=286420 RepID=UPI00037A1730|nr:porin family protein [Hahella ganghwensis]